MRSKLIIDNLGKNSFNRWKRNFMSDSICGMIRDGEVDRAITLMPSLKRWRSNVVGDSLSFYSRRFYIPNERNGFQWQAFFGPSLRDRKPMLSVEAYLIVDGASSVNLNALLRDRDADPHYATLMRSPRTYQKFMRDLKRFIEAVESYVLLNGGVNAHDLVLKELESVQA